MLRSLKRFAWLGLLAVGLQSTQAFSLIQPFVDWQVRDLGYNIDERGDLGGPANIGEEYRRNIPVMYYSFDQNFLDFYGAYGAAEVDKAFAILNSLNNVSSYSAELSEFPLESRRNNWRASALSLMDLKSHVLGIMMEQLGLTDPIRYLWCLHDRDAGANCPIGSSYLITMRNYAIVPGDLSQLVYSPYVNGVLYTYFIRDYCANPPFGYGLAEAAVLPVDQNLLQNNEFLPVASATSGSLYSGNLNPGGFFNGLTRDDVAGLRYLMRSGNVNWEDSPANTVTFFTNRAPDALSLLVTSNLTDFAWASATNTDAALLTLYPNLVIASSIPSYTTVVTSNTYLYYTNYPWNPAGLATLTNATVYDTNVMMVYRRTFANLVTNYLSIPTGYVFPNNNVFTNGRPYNWAQVTVIETNVGTATDPWGPAGSTTLVTNITSKSMWTNMIMGDVFVLPTNSCGFVLLSNVLTKVYYFTNTIVASNTTTSTTSTNFSFDSLTYITSWTNHNFAYLPVLCLTNMPSLRRGVEKVQFVRRDYDSLLGQYFYPQTNVFSLTTVTNSRDVQQVFQRITTTPDFLFTARDMAPGPAAPIRFFRSGRTLNFNTNTALQNLNGPGVIDPVTVITFNKSGPLYYNQSTNDIWRLDELTQTTLLTWGSYDDSTNAPVVYPNSVSLQMLEDMVLLQLQNTTMEGSVGVDFADNLAGSGGQPPYTWTLAPMSPALPPGLNLSYDGSGVVFGVPTVSGIYDVIVRMTDANGRFADWQLEITIDP